MAIRRKKTNGHSGKEVQQRIDALRDDLENLQADMRGLFYDAGNEAQARVNGLVIDAKQYAKGKASEVEEWGEENVETVRKSVRTQPLAACAISMSAGALIGALFLRR